MQKTLMTACAVAVAASLCACDVAPKRGTYDAINAEMQAAVAQGAKAAQPNAVENALLPPLATLTKQLPKARAALDERFNLSFNNVPVQQFFNSLVAGTRYNMLVHPEISGTISANLKDVTLFEALDAIRELYGYDYKVDGTRIYIKPLTMQTRMFQVNYISGSRKGSSNLRVSSTSVATAAASSTGQGGAGGGAPTTGSGAPVQIQIQDSSSVTTTDASNFWVELKESLGAIVGSKEDGRSIVISPQSGVVLIRAMPDELRNVDAYLKATQLAVDRQVILEAKILEVELNSGFQTGVNWASLASFTNSGRKNRISTGFVSPGATLTPLAGSTAQAMATIGPAGISATPGVTLGAAADAVGSMFGLALQTSNFAAMISFLESQGTVHVLSSPRIATMNNQKAVLKIGTDEYFVTKVNTTPGTNSGGTTTGPTVSVETQAFFSGVVLDVTPQIDEHGNIMLHVHPSVSQVSTVTKSLDLGTVGSLTLPLAASNTSEMDSMVRGQDGRIIAIGGLMRQSSTSNRSQVPGAGDVPGLGALFRNTSDVAQKRELVVLIKPTIVEGASSWNEDMLDAGRRIERLDPRGPVRRD